MAGRGSDSPSGAQAANLRYGVPHLLAQLPAALLDGERRHRPGQGRAARVEGHVGDDDSDPAVGEGHRNALSRALRAAGDLSARRLV